MDKPIRIPSLRDREWTALDAVVVAHHATRRVGWPPPSALADGDFDAIISDADDTVGSLVNAAGTLVAGVWRGIGERRRAGVGREP